jgi:cell division topological specificity factor
MRLFQLFKARGSAPVARERLQILLAHERVALGPEDLLGKLRGEIIATVLRHIQVDPGKIMVKMDHDAAVSTLEIEVEIPKESIVGDGKRRAPAESAPMTSAA